MKPIVRLLAVSAAVLLLFSGCAKKNAGEAHLETTRKTGYSETENTRMTSPNTSGTGTSQTSPNAPSDGTGPLSGATNAPSETDAQNAHTQSHTASPTKAPAPTAKKTTYAPVQTTRKPTTPKKTVTTRRPVATTPAHSNSSDSFIAQVISLVNDERAKAGVPPVTAGGQALQNAAQKRAQEIVSSFSHTRPSGKNFSTVFEEFSLSYKTIGENIAYGQQTPQQVMNGWMNSEGHRANILNPNFKQIGVGYLNTTSGGRHYWVQLFYTPRG